MKRLLKWAILLVSALIALVVFVLVFKDSILKRIAEHRIRSRTGMEARIGKMSSSFLSPVVTIQDLKLFNTADFGGTLFLDIPELHVEFDPAALARHELHVTLLRFNLKEVNVVRNAAGQTNVFGILNKTRGRGSDAMAMPKLLKDISFTGIDTLDLTLGKARYVDLKEATNNLEFNLNIQNQVFRNVKSEGDISGILLLLWLRSRGGMSLSPGR